MDAFERARRYVAKFEDLRRSQSDPQDSHSLLFTAAIALLKGFDLAPQLALQILTEYAQRSDEPWTLAELQHKIDSAEATADDKARGYLLGDTQGDWTTYRGLSNEELSRLAPQEVTRPAPKPQFENAKLKELAKRWRPHVGTVWLADRSPVNPYGVSADDFLTALYNREREYVLAFTNNKSQGEAVWPRDPLPTEGPEGVWYLVQPVDGKVYPNPRNLDAAGNPKPSRRSEESVVAFRYLVLESDDADPLDWLGALVQFSLPIAALYTSGRRSIHALVRIDAGSLVEWRDFARTVIKPIFVTLGADQQVAATSVRLSRLPGCRRGDQLQKLLYLNPSPAAKPICALPRQRDVIGAITLAAAKFTPWDAGTIIASASAANLDEAITALENEEARRASTGATREKVIAALDWFSTSPVARELLAKLRPE